MTSTDEGTGWHHNGSIEGSGESIAKVVEYARLAGDHQWLVSRSALGLTMSALYGRMR